MTTCVQTIPSSQQQTLAYDPLLGDIGFMTCMTLVLLGNYAQTGHFGGPLAYTPYNVAAHLAGPENGGLRYDYRRPKHPYSDKFMMAAGHSVPTCYALWMIMGQALYRKHQQTGDQRYHVDPHVAMLPIDALGFRRGAGALKTLLQETGLEDNPLFAQAKGRGIRALSGHAESVDVTNDVNGGPSGVGIATAAGKAAFWDYMGAPESPKVIALEGEFALTEGHAQELKTQALALQVGKRLRVMISDNNAGIDDCLIGGPIGGVISAQFCEVYDLIESVDVLRMERLHARERQRLRRSHRGAEGYGGSRPQGPASVDRHRQDHQGLLAGCCQRKDYRLPRRSAGQLSSHPYALKMNSRVLRRAGVDLREALRRGVRGHPQGPVTDNRERLIQFKTNMDVVMSVLDRNGIGDWLAERLVEIGDTVSDDVKLRIAGQRRSLPRRSPARCGSARRTAEGLRSRTRSPARRSKSPSRSSRSRAKSPDRGARSPKSSSG